jgi:hypothetical protein
MTSGGAASFVLAGAASVAVRDIPWSIEVDFNGERQTTSLN